MMTRRNLLAAASVALTMATGARAKSDNSKIAADALTAADWIAGALTASGYRADFSLQSLAEIDRFFDDQAPGGSPRSGGLLSENLGSRIFAVGSYVGETLRRELGGEWIGDDRDPQAEINISVKLRDGSTIWPIQRVMKRFRNGREDSIASYGAELAKLR